LRNVGVKDGDVVGMYLPSVPEIVTALFAVARIGAVIAPAFSGYGADALAERLKLVGAKYLITADGFLRRGKIVDMKSVADAAVDASDVTCTIVISRDDVTPSRRKGDMEWSSLFEHGVDREYEMFAAEKPWLIAFTSGSTGRPKAAVHTHGGLPYQGTIERAYCLDLSKDSVLYYPSDMGWITTPYSIVTSFILGGRHLLYEGAPTYPQPDTIWSLVERYGVTTLGCGPTLMRQIAAEGVERVEKYELKTLDLIASAGEPMTSAAWRWMHKNVGRGRIPIINITGGTEIGGALLCGSPIVPMREGQFSGQTPGVTAIVVDENGQRIFNTLGDIAIPGPWPSMSRGFWNDPERWSETYKSKFPGLYLHGDRAIEFDDGSWEMPGRSDDLLKIGGKRIGPGEFESLALEVAGVINAAAVGVPDPIKGETVVLLVVLEASTSLSAEDVEAKVMLRIETALGKPFRPSKVAIIDEVPLTRSGKVHRRALRSWIQGVPPGDLSNLLNPGSEASIKRLFGA
jgi:acetyl-CoA synthetase